MVFRFMMAVGMTLIPALGFSQTVSVKLANAFQKFEQDAQLANAVSSLYVIEAKTGKVVFDRNSRIGLAPASTLKVVTSATAFSILGQDFRYLTTIGYAGNVVNNGLEGNLYITGSGDPTFGSWRFTSTSEDYLMQKIGDSLLHAGIATIRAGALLLDERSFGDYDVPGAWVWEDIGNYYGAGATYLNWRENQYDLVLRSGPAPGTGVDIVETKPFLYDVTFVNELTAGPANSGDQAYIYLAPHGKTARVRGTIPAGRDRFVISGSFSRPAQQFLRTLTDYMKARSGFSAPQAGLIETGKDTDAQKQKDLKIVFRHYSPSLDSIVYWFNQKSINLYGEAMVKTMAFKETGQSSTQKGVEILKDFWKEKGIDPNELNLYDGSGLSPMNRVTTHAQVSILKYAREQSWFRSFLNALPEYNGMTMKSGTIGDVKAFTGYHQARDGHEYIFSFIVNNYNGSSSSLVQKMYRVLDVLK